MMEAKSRVPFMKLQGNEKGTSCLHNAALELSVIHVVTRAFRTGPSAWSYNPTSRPHDEMDIAHIVQVQLQMHATGARVGYLCSWSVANGSKIFKMKYSEEFMRGASEVLQPGLSNDTFNLATTPFRSAILPKRMIQCKYLGIA
ncbi:MAG: hypothetical protein HC767_04265 [Akkermansiaceae bacterium]|nr:hypothetical protein [Akkermansiaceae bacterium]